MATLIENGRMLAKGSRVGALRAFTRTTKCFCRLVKVRSQLFSLACYGLRGLTESLQTDRTPLLASDVQPVRWSVKPA